MLSWPSHKAIASYRAKLEGLGYMPAQVLYHLILFAKLVLCFLTRKQRLWQLNEKKFDIFMRRFRAKHPTNERRRKRRTLGRRRVAPGRVTAGQEFNHKTRQTGALRV
jgi:hypothetical protein